MARTGPKPLAKNFIAQAWQGFVYPFEGLGFISKNHLWGLTGVAIGINVALLAGLVWATLHWAAPFLADFDTWGANLFAWSFWPSIWGVFGAVMLFGAYIVLVALNGVLLMLVGQAVASPFLDMLSEQTENILLSKKSPEFNFAQAMRGVVMAVADLFWGLTLLAIVSIPVWILGFWIAPVAGVITFCFTALLNAQEFVTLPLAREFVGYRKRFGLIWRNRWHALGFGTSTMMVLMVPGLNLVLLPIAAVGGTLLYVDLREGGQLGEFSIWRGPSPDAGDDL